MFLKQVLILLLAYLIGAFPTAYLAGKWIKGIDIREHGSRNVGATNVFRCVGKGWGVLVLLLDIMKGVLAVTLWGYWMVLSPMFLLICGVTVVCGHNWTIFLKFKGGKGVATTLGIFLGLFPLTVLYSLLIAIFLIIVTGYVSVGSIVGAASFPIFFFLLHKEIHQFPIFMVLIALMSLLPTLIIETSNY